MRVFQLFSLAIFTLSVSDSFGLTIELNQLYGELESPGYPEGYSDNEDISWVIAAPPGYQIVVYFTVFDLEDSFDEDMGGACVYDYVQVEDRGVNKRLCGNNKSYRRDSPKSWQKFRSENSSTAVRFVSDYSNDLESSPRPLGFKAHYFVEDMDECAKMRRLVETTLEDWEELVYCNHFCVNVPGSYYCTCRSGFELHDNRHTCKGSCTNILITSDEGVIQSPDYPKPYPRLTDCDWTIQVEQGKSLNIQFNRNFKVENHPENGCVYDWLKITLNGVEQLYCQDSPYNSSFVQTNLRAVRLELHSDHALEDVGFSMTFNTTRTRCLEARDVPDNGEKPPNPKGYYEFEDKISFKCNPGYEVTPSEGTQITCLSDGTWDRLSPTCRIKRCGLPTDLLAVPNSHIANMETLSVTYRGKAVVACNEAYELTSGSLEWRCSEDAVWVTTSPRNGGNIIPVCSPICGIKNPGNLFSGFISGGSPTAPHEWPWMAFIRLSARPSLDAGSSFCGGALISEEFVLTAAHCLTDKNYRPAIQRPPTRVFVWLGAYNRSESEETRKASLVNVAEVIRHPLFDSDTLNYDYALLRLNATVVMGKTVRPICIPSQSEHFNLRGPSESLGWVAGWGRVVDFRPSPILMHVQLPTVDTEVCWADFTRQARMHSIENFNTRYNGLTDKMFCAGDGSRSRGATCQGDSGGSFMQRVPRTRKYYTLGLVSYGVSKTPCGRSVSYTVFAKIDRSVADWIRGVMASSPS